MFVSIEFILLLTISLIAFYIVPRKLRKYVLLAVSYVFCARINIYSAIVLGVTTVFIYLTGLGLEVSESNGKYKKTNLYIGAIIVLIAALFVFKYAGQLGNVFADAEGSPNEILIKIVMPIGFSFYLFQGIAYLSDVYQGKMAAEKDFVAVALSLSFFPKLISGPIERNTTLLPQIKNLPNVSIRDTVHFGQAISYMLYGYFMKMVLADPLSNPIRIMFDNPTEFSSKWMTAGILMYTLQIYFDFAGYSYIAVGCAKLFGIDLMENFRQPYLATSISDFWRRWHISLSSWLRDYLYIPLGGNRKGKIRKCLNTVIVFAVCGMWHGSGLTFIVWGLLHGVYSVADTLLPKKRLHSILNTGSVIARIVKFIIGICSRIITFCAVALAWVFFRANTLQGAIQYLTCTVTNGAKVSEAGPTIELLGLNPIRIGVLIVGIAVAALFDLLAEAKHNTIPRVVYGSNYYLKYFVYFLLIISIWVFGMYGPGYQPEQFIYMQF